MFFKSNSAEKGRREGERRREGGRERRWCSVLSRRSLSISVSMRQYCSAVSRNCIPVSSGRPPGEAGREEKERRGGTVGSAPRSRPRAQYPSVSLSVCVSTGCAASRNCIPVFARPRARGGPGKREREGEGMLPVAPLQYSISMRASESRKCIPVSRGAWKAPLSMCALCLRPASRVCLIGLTPQKAQS